MKRRGICLVLLTVLLLGLSTAMVGAAEPDFELHARGIYMVNTDSSETVYSHNADRLMYPASLTAIMTAVLALESIEDLSAERVTVPGDLLEPLYLQGASNVELKDGEVVDMEDLVHAVLLPSGCDASTVIAWHLGNGDVDAFVDRMNSRARELGALHTVFTNPTGLHDDDQVTTPYDMYKISSYAMSLPLFREIVGKTAFTMKATNKNSSRTKYSTNVMMDASSSWYDDRVWGVKSGYTSQAGRCMISTASDGSGEYILIVMGANLDQPAADGTQPNLAYRDSRNLYNWAFENYTVHRLTALNDVIIPDFAVKGGKSGSVDLIAASDCSALLERGQNPVFIQPDIKVAKFLKAPVEAGMEAGKVEFTLNGEQLGSVKLVAANEVKKSWLWPILTIILGIIILAFIIWRIYNKRQRNQFRPRKRKDLKEPRQYQDLAR